MWVRTMTKDLLNLGAVEYIEIAFPGSQYSIAAVGPSLGCDLAVYETHAEAEAALDKLHEWIATNGMYELEGTPFFNSVFDFRKLEVEP